jgi:hypothetical protein
MENAPVRMRPATRREAIVGAGAASLALLTALYAIRPLHSATVGYDSASSVIYFDRIVGGRLLEADLGATPKPLLTAVFGMLYNVFQDWRPILWATLIAYAAGIGGAAVLARRSGGLAAGVFVAVGLVGSSALLVDASRAYAVSWGMLGWVVAGLALTSSRPHFAVAGLAILVASLARIETIVVLGVAGVALLASVLSARRRHVAPPPRSAALLLLGSLAIPILMVHDWLLTRDPFYWIHVADRYSAAYPASVDTPTHVLLRVAAVVIGLGGVSVLAALGGVTLLRRRDDAVALGLFALGPGIAAFLVLLAARGTYVSTRYLTPIELAVVFSAGVGFGSLRVSWLNDRGVRRALGPLAPRVRVPAVILAVAGAAAISALGVSRTFAPLDQATTRLIHSELLQAENSDIALPAIRQVLRGTIGAPRPGPILLVPSLAQPRFAVGTGLPVTSIGSIEDARQRGTMVSVPGGLIYHDRGADPPGLFTPLESTETPTVGGVILRPVEANPVRGYWLWQVPD